MTAGKHPRLFLTGLQGMLASERFPIELGQSVVVGRSRTCDISTRRARKFLRSAEHTQRRILFTKGFLKVSRRHVRISFLSPERVEIRDLSQNGTFVNGERVVRRMLTDLDSRPADIMLARSELLRLEM